MHLDELERMCYYKRKHFKGAMDMVDFLQEREVAAFADEILEQNEISCSRLRSLIAGDFYLEQWDQRFLLLHEKGLFVLMQCHQTGMIQGQEGAPLWTDLNYLGHGKAFANPLMENENAIEKLSQRLKLQKEEFHSCILFDVQCELRQVPPEHPAFSIMRVDQLEDFFAQLLPKLPVRYTHGQLTALNDIFLLVSAEE